MNSIYCVEQSCCMIHGKYISLNQNTGEQNADNVTLPFLIIIYYFYIPSGKNLGWGEAAGVTRWDKSLYCLKANNNSVLEQCEPHINVMGASCSRWLMKNHVRLKHFLQSYVPEFMFDRFWTGGAVTVVHQRESNEASLAWAGSTKPQTSMRDYSRHSSLT